MQAGAAESCSCQPATILLAFRDMPAMGAPPKYREKYMYFLSSLSLFFAACHPDSSDQSCVQSSVQVVRLFDEMVFRIAIGDIYQPCSYTPTSGKTKGTTPPPERP